MTSTMPFAADATEPYTPVALPSGPILVASDASTDSDSALPLAEILSVHVGTPVGVTSVLPFATSTYAFDVMPVPLVNYQTMVIDREADVRAQIARLAPTGSAWPVTVREGQPAREIIDHAVALDARLILTGRGRHGAVERALGGESVLRLLQLGDRPIFAVEPGLTRLPRRVVIATDLSVYSDYAARVAMSFVSPDSTIFLVHVAPSLGDDPVLHEHAASHRERAHAHFVAMRRILATAEVRFEDVVLTGTPSREILRFATSAEADLIVSATHGYGYVRRFLLGSVASALVRGAHCSVLCVPGSAGTRSAASARAVQASHTRRFAPRDCDKELAAFSDRHEGKPCTVSIHQPDLGAQTLGHSLNLVGASFDQHASNASLMFGASHLVGAHLTHRVARVTEIDLLTDDQGRERVLRLVHGAGYTLVALE